MACSCIINIMSYMLGDRTYGQSRFYHQPLIMSTLHIYTDTGKSPEFHAAQDVSKHNINGIEKLTPRCFLECSRISYIMGMSICIHLKDLWSRTVVSDQDFIQEDRGENTAQPVHQE